MKFVPVYGFLFGVPLLGIGVFLVFLSESGVLPLWPSLPLLGIGLVGCLPVWISTLLNLYMPENCTGPHN